MNNTNGNNIAMATIKSKYHIILINTNILFMYFEN